jgi:hypothetical protein
MVADTTDTTGIVGNAGIAMNECIEYSDKLGAILKIGEVEYRLTICLMIFKENKIEEGHQSILNLQNNMNLDDTIGKRYNITGIVRPINIDGLDIDETNVTNCIREETFQELINESILTIEHIFISDEGILDSIAHLYVDMINDIVLTYEASNDNDNNDNDQVEYMEIE